jgi:hypothetical protein
VDLFALETHEFYAEPVYDDSVTDYLYTKYSLVVTAVINGLVDVVPAAGPNGLFMAYRFTGGIAGITPGPDRAPSIARGELKPGLAPGGNLNGIEVGEQIGSTRDIQIVPSRAPVTHQAVRHRLTTPRGPLYVFAGKGMESGTPPAGGFGPPGAGAELILTSPVAPYDVDCKNGPIPRLMGITAAMGDAETFMVDFAVETYVNEALQNNERPFSALLSNRWKQSHSVDKDGYTTVVTAGLALFRTDMVYALESSPDLDRPLLFMPVPQGFVREIDYVEGREDVTGIAYQYRDVQQSVNFVAGPFVGAAEITAVHRQSVTSNVDFLPRAIELAERGTQMLLNAKWLRGESSAPRGAGRTPPPIPKLPSRVRGPRP